MTKEQLNDHKKQEYINKISPNEIGMVDSISNQAPIGSKKKSSRIKLFINIFCIMIALFSICYGIYSFYNKVNINENVKLNKIEEIIDFKEKNVTLDSKKMNEIKNEIKKQEELSNKQKNIIKEQEIIIKKQKDKLDSSNKNSVVNENINNEYQEYLDRKLTGDVLINFNINKASQNNQINYESRNINFEEENNQEYDSIFNLKATNLEMRSASKLPNLTYLLKRGTHIPCALKTGIDTTLPGFVICQVLNDIYSANGKTLLIERGSTIFGEQTSSLKQGQARTFVLWTRIDSPSGITANLDSPATDRMGFSGIPGIVDTHFSERFSAALFVSTFETVLDVAGNIIQSKLADSEYKNIYPRDNNNKSNASDIATETLKSSINIPPTLYIKPASIVNVLVARDINFKDVYKIIEKNEN